MEKFFKLKEHKSTFKIELMAGLTSFFASVYIVAVNSSILSDGGKEMQALIIATVLASVVGCLLVAFLSNTPLITMPGMGINALFTYTVIQTMGLSFSQALGAVLVAGVLFTIVALTPLSKVITDAIPVSLKSAMTVGIGLFITFLGLQKSGLIISDKSTLVKLGNIANIHILIFLATLVLTVILFVKNVPGNFLISIIFGTVLSLIFGTIKFSGPVFAIPNFASYKDLFFSLSFDQFLNPNFWIAAFSLGLVLIFENIGLLHSQVGGLLNQPEKIQKALNAVALSTIVCSLLGTSPTVSTVEGQAGIVSGGKTGLTSVVLYLHITILILYTCINNNT